MADDFWTAEAHLAAASHLLLRNDKRPSQYDLELARTHAAVAQAKTIEALSASVVSGYTGGLLVEVRS